MIHPTSVVEDGAIIGPGTSIWHFCQVRGSAQVGSHVSLGKGVYVDNGASIGSYSRVQNGVSIYSGVEIREWCFVGPHVIFTNDLRPRAGSKIWNEVKTLIDTGASIGAGATIIAGVTLGAFSMTAAGAVVTETVPPFHLAIGLPARIPNMVCACGETLLPLGTGSIELLRECCKQKLESDMLRVARFYLTPKAPVTHNC